MTKIKDLKCGDLFLHDNKIFVFVRYLASEETFESHLVVHTHNYLPAPPDFNPYYIPDLQVEVEKVMIDVWMGEYLIKRTWSADGT